MASATPPPPGPPWREVGRAWDRRDPPAWITWVAPLGEGGGRHALYRTLVVAEGEVAVMVELDPRHPAGARVLHRCRRGVPADPGEARGCVRALLAEADAAVARALAAMATGAAVTSRPTPPRAAAPRPADDAAEHRVRERAYLLWEREGRPEGRAEEFWDHARRQEEPRVA